MKKRVAGETGLQAEMVARTHQRRLGLDLPSPVIVRDHYHVGVDESVHSLRLAVFARMAAGVGHHSSEAVKKKAGCAYRPGQDAPQSSNQR